MPHTPLMHTLVSILTLAQPSPAEAAWVSRNAITIDTVEAGNGFQDLEPLRDVFANARVVGLGESTHGTREHFQMKHRLVEFLASELGYTIFSIEASTPEAFRVDDYVSKGEGDPARLIAGMYFWTWNTEEVLSMVQWMRGFNQREKDNGKSIRFTGFDMQERRVCQRIVREFVSQADPTYLPTLDKHWATLEQAGPAQPGFATATGTLPVDAARGKRAVLRGHIRTRAVQGFAGLWLRIDGKDDAQLGFDNMSDRGPRGDTDWKEFSLALDVPRDARNINFGCLMTGTGDAWFDSCVLELDAVPFSSKDLDLTFDRPAITGLSRFSPGYDITIDHDTTHEGAGALRLHSNGAAGESIDATPAAQDVLNYLTAQRNAFLEADMPAKKVDWVIHNARIILQWARMTSGGQDSFNVRDASMAKNVLWLLEQDPDAKVVLWAHNMHMSTQPGFQGRHLRDALGDRYVAVGFAAGGGQYYAMPGATGKGYVHDLTPAPLDSVEAIFEHAGFTIAALDLRKASPDVPGSKWVFEPRGIRTIGALAMDQQFAPYRMKDTFDVLLYTKDTTAARQLKTAPAPLEGR